MRGVMTKVTPLEAAADEGRDRAADPWRIAFAVSFILALLAAARTDRRS